MNWMDGLPHDFRAAMRALSLLLCAGIAARKGIVWTGQSTPETTGQNASR
jgi:hypothetical protein